MVFRRRLYLWDTRIGDDGEIEHYRGERAHAQWAFFQFLNAVSFFSVVVVFVVISIRVFKRKNDFELLVGLIMFHQIVSCIAGSMSVDPTSPEWEIDDVFEPTGMIIVANNFLHIYSTIVIVFLS